MPRYCPHFGTSVTSNSYFPLGVVRSASSLSLLLGTIATLADATVTDIYRLSLTTSVAATTVVVVEQLKRLLVSRYGTSRANLQFHVALLFLFLLI